MTKKKDNNYYVYVHRKKSNGDVFYVGKGKGKRAWATSKTVSRSQMWRSTSAKYGHTVEVILDNLQEWYAFELECELILKYGRIDVGTGCLVNHTDGGDGTSGWVPSESYRTNVSTRVSGVNHPLFNPTVYKFINMVTKESYFGTKQDFKQTFNIKFNLSNKRHCKWWYIDGTLTNAEVEACITKFKGKNCYNKFIDTNTYSFTNILTKESVLCKRYELEDRFNIKVGTLFGKRANKSIHGWCLTTVLNTVGESSILYTQSGLLNGRSDKNIYTFNNINSESFTGTRFDFEKKYMFKIAPLFSKTLNRTICKGWSLSK